jgi:hypothetical protein
VYCAAWFKPLGKVPFDELSSMQKVNFAKLLTDEHWGEMPEDDRDDLCQWMFKETSRKELMHLTDNELTQIYNEYSIDLQKSMIDWFFNN